VRSWAVVRVWCFEGTGMLALAEKTSPTLSPGAASSSLRVATPLRSPQAHATMD